MEIDAVKARMAMNAGVGFVCAHCEYYWDGVSRGTKGCLQFECGGPIIGLTYPYYKGILEGIISQVCFVCGDRADGVFMSKDGIHGVGYCNKHKSYLTELKPIG